ncbi:DNA-3-methyladenine glycosylase 1 [Dyadobacter sp. CECT 9623]|uniref:DNA-3-methyladenine glycosylase 1 n=1 Tax=Dyadobacter linearis TaxID=2823330 RepID=A0ABN7RF30_9BACT|nr:DNA-3-methyladenine glycosylase I [Dyadobacter sp. CECT 9623]CAG5071844.1 DNA-3-methyladenine glycosylase 1 [Dyadobacter sp. CECT 9623]
MSYCDYINNNISELSDFLLNKEYHDNHYGYPIDDDDELFGRLLLEINQAGLSWTLMLRKQHSFREAYAGFSIEKVAAFDENDRERLMQDAGIVRNRLKINAAIVNAQKILELQKEYGSFKGWINANHPLTKPEWIKLFKKTFKFTGGEIVNEFLMSTGYLPGAHSPDCPIYQKIEQLAG